MRTALYVALGALFAALLLEALFRILPVSTTTATGYYVDDKILTYPARHAFTSSTGWNLQNAQRHRANNFGFLSAGDFVSDVNAIAVIGDSFVEASMLDVKDQFGSQLQPRVSRSVYSLGGPGSSILDYAERIRFASERLQVRNFVILLENGDLDQALCGSGNVHAACLDRSTLVRKTERQSEPGTLKKLLRNLALPQYLFSQLKVTLSTLSPAHWLQTFRDSTPTSASTPKRPLSINQAAASRIMDEFFARISAYPIDTLTFVLLGKDRSTATDPDEARIELVARAAQHGRPVIDMTPVLEGYTQDTGLSTRVSPTDGHLNPLALGLVAERVSHELRQPATYSP